MSNNYHYLFKFVLIGDPNVGKTTLIQQFTEETHRNTYVPSQRIHFASKVITLNELHLKCQLWDMPRANEAEGTAFVESLFRKAASILLVFDLTNRSSFENLGKWVEDIRSKCNNEIAIIVVGNKQDKQGRAVALEEIVEFTKSVGTDYYEVSSYDQKSIHLLFQNVSKSILEIINSKNDSNQPEIIRSRFKRGTKMVQNSSPAVSSNSEITQKQEQVEIQSQKTEESEHMINIMDQMTSSLKKTIILEEILKKIKSSFTEKGLECLSDVKHMFSQSQVAQSSAIVRDLFEIFTMIEQSLTEQHSAYQRVSLQNEDLFKYKAIGHEFEMNQAKIEQLQKKIESLTVQKGKLEQYRENSEKREQNLIQMIEKIKREKKNQTQKHEQLLDEYSKLESKNMNLSKQLSRYQQLQSQIKVQQLIEEKYNSEIIQQLDSLEGSEININLLTKLKKKFSMKQQSNFNLDFAETGYN